MTAAPRTPKIPYGGDYNPEQWPQEVWDEDHRLFDRAGIDTLTVGVFSWSLTQPTEDTYDLTVLDRILDRAAAEDWRLQLVSCEEPWAFTTPLAPTHNRGCHSFR